MSQFRPQRFKAGTVIFCEGDMAGSAYLVQSGKAKVTVGKRPEEKDVAFITENGIFGEMSLIDGSPRSATVTAVEDMECIVIDQRKFDGLFENAHPIARKLFEIQCHRLRRMTQQQLKQEQLKSTDTIQ